MYSLFLYALPSESQSYTTLKGVEPKMQSLVDSFPYSITGLHYFFGCQTLWAAYVH